MVLQIIGLTWMWSIIAEVILFFMMAVSMLPKGGMSAEEERTAYIVLALPIVFALVSTVGILAFGWHMGA